MQPSPNKPNVILETTRRPYHYFITGTDTDAGKTLVTCALLYKAKQVNLSTLGLKPVAAGCMQTEAGLRNLDGLRLMEQSSVQLPYEYVNPVALEPPIAPHLGADKMEQHLDARHISRYVKDGLLAQAQFVLVEGAGGWRVPLNSKETLAHVVQQLNLPVILVVGLKLGCLNHALLSVEAIMHDGLKLAGWIGNSVDPNMAESQANVDTLTDMIAAPCLGYIPFLTTNMEAEGGWVQKVTQAADYLVLPT